MGFSPRKKGSPHAGAELAQRLRNIFLKNGYNETLFPQNSWPETVSALTHKEPLPLQLFSVREATASAVIVDESVSLQDGEELVAKLFSGLGLKPVFEKSGGATDFTPETETDILVGPSPVGKMGVLSRSGVDAPAVAFEFSIGGLGVALGMAKDEKAFFYPQFHGDWDMTDREIARLITTVRSPGVWGREIASKIVKTCTLYPLQAAPCEFKIWEKEVHNHNLQAWLVAEKGTLCGKDYANELFVYGGNIVSSPALGGDGFSKQAVSKGVKTGVSFLSAFADYAAALIEEEPLENQRVEFSSISTPEEANILIPELVTNYLDSKNLLLSVSGDVNLAVEARVKKLWTHEQPR